MHTVFYEAVYTCLPQTSNREHEENVGNLKEGITEGGKNNTAI